MKKTILMVMHQKSYLLQEILDLLELESHTIRYWEKHLPTISKKYDDRGRRIYTVRDLHFFNRLKNLIQKHGFTLDGAVNQILDELSDKKVNVTARILGLRQSLIESRLNLNRYSDITSQEIKELDHSGKEEGLASEKSASQEVQERIDEVDLIQVPNKLTAESLAETSMSQVDHVPSRIIPASKILKALTLIKAEDYKKPVLETLLPNEIASGNWVLLYPEPGIESQLGNNLSRTYSGSIPVSPVRKFSLIELIAEKLRAFVDRYGKAPYWVIGVRRNHLQQFSSYVRRHGWWGLDRDRILVITQADIRWDEKDVNYDLDNPGYSAGLAGLVYSLRTVKSEIIRKLPRLVQHLSMENPLLTIGDPSKWLLFLEQNVSVSSGLSRLGKNRWYATGESFWDLHTLLDDNFLIPLREFSLFSGKNADKSKKACYTWSWTGIVTEGVNPLFYESLIKDEGPILQEHNSAQLAKALSRKFRSWEKNAYGPEEVSAFDALFKEEYHV